MWTRESEWCLIRRLSPSDVLIGIGVVYMCWYGWVCVRVVGIYVVLCDLKKTCKKVKKTNYFNIRYINIDTSLRIHKDMAAGQWMKYYYEKWSQIEWAPISAHAWWINRILKRIRCHANTQSWNHVKDQHGTGWVHFARESWQIPKDHVSQWMLATNPTLRDQKIHKNLLKDGSRDALRSVLSTQPLSYIQDGKSFLSLHVLSAAERPKAFPPRWAAGPRELRPSLSPTGVAGPTQRPEPYVIY